MAFAAMIGPIISGIAGLAGAMVSASAARDQADAERAVSAANAEELRKKASREQAIGAQESQRVADKVRQQSALTRASEAQAGLSTSEGTPLLLQGILAQKGWYEGQVAMTNAEDKQRTDLARGDIERFQGEVKASSLEKSANAGLLGGFASLAKGVGTAFSGGGGASFG